MVGHNKQHMWTRFSNSAARDSAKRSRRRSIIPQNARCEDDCQQMIANEFHELLNAFLLMAFKLTRCDGVN